ncbi:hypothetical protein [Peribacillus simplex]|nr:hypothetical protein [Peribacillus simplex]
MIERSSSFSIEFTREQRYMQTNDNIYRFNNEKNEVENDDNKAEIT